MSIEVDWERLTGGPEGEALAGSIKTFIHDRFQQIQLPRFIRSVNVHTFEFGSKAPHVEVKDVCDPLPDFYESDDEESPEDEASHETGGNRADSSEQQQNTDQNLNHSVPKELHIENSGPTETSRRPQLKTIIPATEATGQIVDSPGSLLGSQVPKTGIPGGTSNLSYFHLPLSAGLSGSSTPMRTGPRFGGSILDHLHNNNNNSSNNLQNPTSPSTSALRQSDALPALPGSPSGDRGGDDLQIVTHLRYDGDVRLSLTAEVMFDYPMQSFVGIPLQLNVTGLTFDGVAILAYIKHKAHFCFLAPEDADALVGGEASNELSGGFSDDLDTKTTHGRESGHNEAAWEAGGKRKPVGGLFEEIRVESEIGEREKGKQVLKNIGKVEKFVLDQVRRIFENELVYPSFWTFLV